MRRACSRILPASDLLSHLYFAAFQEPLTEAAMLVTAFIPGDLLKAGIAGMLTSSLVKARPGSVLSRS